MGLKSRGKKSLLQTYTIISHKSKCCTYAGVECRIEKLSALVSHCCKCSGMFSNTHTCNAETHLCEKKLQQLLGRWNAALRLMAAAALSSTTRWFLLLCGPCRLQTRLRGSMICSWKSTPLKSKSIRLERLPKDKVLVLCVLNSLDNIFDEALPFWSHASGWNELARRLVAFQISAFS